MAHLSPALIEPAKGNNPVAEIACTSIRQAAKFLIYFIPARYVSNYQSVPDGRGLRPWVRLFHKRTLHCAPHQRKQYIMSTNPPTPRNSTGSDVTARGSLVVSMTTKTSHLTNDFNSIRRFLLIKSDASRPKKILFPAGPTQRLGFIVFSLQHQHICSFSWKVSDLSSAE
jgi:hypothetical protein